MTTVNQQRALLVQGGALGDFILSLRIVAALRAAGATQITLLGRSHAISLASMAGIDRTLDLDSGGFHPLFDREAALPNAATSQLADHALVINMMADASGNSSRRLADATGGNVFDLDPRLRPDWSGHVTDQWLAAWGRRGFSTDVGPPTLIVPDDHRRHARSALTDGAKPLVIIHPGSGGSSKCWPPDRFAELAELLCRADHAACFLVGPAEIERLPRRTLDRLRCVAPVLTRDSLPDVAALLAAADAYVGNDSGITHLAAACGTPTLAVFGPTDPAHWRPLGDHVRVIADPAWPDGATVLAEFRALPAVVRII